MEQNDLELFPLFRENFPERLYHYTNLEGLQGILSSGLLRASDVSYMNDTSEMFYSYEVCRQRYLCNRQATASMPHQEHSFSDPVKNTADLLRNAPSDAMFCAVSFCGARDELSQWRAYGDRGGGCALVFDGAALQLAVRRQSRLMAGPIIYEVKQQHEMIDEVIEKLVPNREAPTGELVRKVQYLAPFMKSSVFAQEKEWRIGRFHNEPHQRRGGDLSNLIDFRASRGLLVPFAMLDLRVNSLYPRLPIVEVILGPTSNATAAERSMRLYLDIHGYGDAEITASGLPLRF